MAPETYLVGLIIIYILFLLYVLYEDGREHHPKPKEPDNLLGDVSKDKE